MFNPPAVLSGCLHFIGQSGTGKSHLAVALGVEAIRAGRSVYFCPLADIIDSLAKADRGRPGGAPAGAHPLSLPHPAADHRRDRLRHTGRCRGEPVLSIGQRALRMRRHDPDVQPRICRVGPGVRRSRHRHGLAGSAAPSRGRRTHRGVQLPHAPARRSAAAGSAAWVPRRYPTEAPRPTTQDRFQHEPGCLSPVPQLRLSSVT